MAQYRLVLSAGGHDEADSKLSMWAGAKLAFKDWVSQIDWTVWRPVLIYSSLGSSCFSTSGKSLIVR